MARRLILELSSDPLIGAHAGEERIDLWVLEEEDGRVYERNIGRLLVQRELLAEARRLTAAITAGFPKLELVWRQDGALLPPEASDWKVTKVLKLAQRLLR